MAAKPTLSPTKLTTFLACPVRYRWTFVDPRGKFYIRAKSCFSFGTSLHRVLERFHDSGDTGVETVHEAMAALEESWIESGFSSPEEMAEAYAEGQAIVERHVEEAAKRSVSANTILVEHSMKLEFPNFTILGRLDRVDEHADGTLEVIDYKSGRSEVTEDDVATDLAMAIYQLMLATANPGRPVRATILALRTGSQASASLSREELESLRNDLETLGDAILAEDHRARIPVYKPLCSRCDFTALCRRHPSFAEAEASALRAAT